MSFDAFYGIYVILCLNLCRFTWSEEMVRSPFVSECLSLYPSVLESVVLEIPSFGCFHYDIVNTLNPYSISQVPYSTTFPVDIYLEVDPVDYRLMMRDINTVGPIAFRQLRITRHRANLLLYQLVRQRFT